MRAGLLASRPIAVAATVLLTGSVLSGCQSASTTGAASGSPETSSAGSGSTSSGSGASGSPSVRVASQAASTPFGPVGSAPSQTQDPNPKSGEPFTIVALGDSVPAGTNCGCDPFPQLVANAASATGAKVSLLNVSHEGWTTANVLDQVTKDQSVRSAVQEANLVLLTIGANDLTNLADEGPQSCDIDCIHAGVDEHVPALGEVITTLHQIDQVPVRRIAWTTYWNVFADGQQARSSSGDAYVDWSEQVTQYANSAYAQEVTAHQGQVVDTYAPFKGANGVVDPTTLLASDGDHPNAEGHKLIAKVIEETLGLPGN